MELAVGEEEAFLDAKGAFGAGAAEVEVDGIIGGEFVDEVAEL